MFQGKIPIRMGNHKMGFGASSNRFENSNCDSRSRIGPGDYENQQDSINSKTQQINGLKRMRGKYNKYISYMFPEDLNCTIRHSQNASYDAKYYNGRQILKENRTPRSKVQSMSKYYAENTQKSDSNEMLDTNMNKSTLEPLTDVEVYMLNKHDLKNSFVDEYVDIVPEAINLDLKTKKPRKQNSNFKYDSLSLYHKNLGLLDKNIGSSNNDTSDRSSIKDDFHTKFSVRSSFEFADKDGNEKKIKRMVDAAKEDYRSKDFVKRVNFVDTQKPVDQISDDLTSFNRRNSIPGNSEDTEIHSYAN